MKTETKNINTLASRSVSHNPARAGFFVWCVAVLIILGNVLSIRSASAQDRIILDGEHVKITAVTFSGNTAFESDDLLARIQTQPSLGLISKILTAWQEPNNYVNAVSLVQDSALLQEVYRDHGFLFATVTVTLVIDTPAVSGAVTFTMTEGKRCKVDSVTVQDAGMLTGPERDIVRMKAATLAGRPYVKNELRDCLGSIVNYMQDNGYRKSHLVGNPVIRLNHTLDGVAVSVVIDPGLKYRFGRPAVIYDIASLNQCFAEEAVRKEVEFYDGQLFSRTRSNMTEDNLRHLGVFEIVRVDLLTENVDTVTRITPTNIYLKMRKDWEFSPDFILSNEYHEFNAGVALTLANHNVFCAAQDLSFTAAGELPWVVNAFNLSNYRASVYEKFFQPRIQLPGILDYRNTSFTQSFGFSHVSIPIADAQGHYNNDSVPFIQNKLSFSMQLNIRQAAYTYLIPQISFIRVVTNTEQLDANQRKGFSNTELVSKQPNLIFALTLTRDNTNNLFVPTEGSSGVLSLKTNVLNSPYFYKAEATTKWYRAIGTQTVLAFRLHGGLIYRHRNISEDILFEEKFVVGGAYSLRGWQIYDPGLGWGIDTSSRIPRSGYAVFEANVEWRYQWFILRDSWINRVIWNRLSHSLFLDAGQTWSERTNVAWVPEMYKQIALAWGIGLRYDTPVGPFRVDFGWKLYDPATGDNPTFARIDGNLPYLHLMHPQIQLAIGNAF